MCSLRSVPIREKPTLSLGFNVCEEHGLYQGVHNPSVCTSVCLSVFIFVMYVCLASASLPVLRRREQPLINTSTISTLFDILIAQESLRVT